LKVVLDPNVIISALLSPSGAPAQLVRFWVEGEFDLICSGRLLGELERAFAYPKLSKHIHQDEAAAFVDLLRRSAVLVDDPELLPSVLSPDPQDNYLIALAETHRAVLVSGDQDLLSLSTVIPVFSPRAFLSQL